MAAILGGLVIVLVIVAVVVGFIAVMRYIAKQSRNDTDNRKVTAENAVLWHVIGVMEGMLMTLELHPDPALAEKGLRLNVQLHEMIKGVSPDEE